MASHPVYPYAFIQVPAVARRSNVQVVCQDLLGVPERDWAGIIEAWQAEIEPDMFLITLRNTDSMNYADYQLNEKEQGSSKGYFPIEATRKLILTIRALSDKPVAVGGFGFSILARELMPVLRPDFGVCGGPDDFFQRFPEIMQGDYSQVANLLYFQGDKVVANNRVFFPPSPEIEYTAQAIQEMLRFYDRFPKPGFKGAPLEIMRGCSHSCVFCCEPFVAGRKVQYRDIQAIIGELELLVENGVREIDIISSELNPEGNAFILQLADEIRRFNARQPPEHTVSWYGSNYLLQLNEEEYQRLSGTGFVAGWFDITGLDDRNAQAMRTPYRNESLLSYLKDYLHFRGRENLSADVAGIVGDEEHAPAAAAANQKVSWSMFLGNPAATMETIRETIAVANREGLARSFNSCHIIRPMRVFNYERPEQETLAVTFSINNRLKRVSYEQTMPSFAYPPALLKHLGSEAALESMFTHISETYLSMHYEETRDWPGFLEQHAPEVWMIDRSNAKNQDTAEQAQETIDVFLREFLHNYGENLLEIGLPQTWSELLQMTPYTLALALYRRWDSEAAVYDAICAQLGLGKDDERQPIVGLFLKTLLHRFNIQLSPHYKVLFI